MDFFTDMFLLVQLFTRKNPYFQLHIIPLRLRGGFCAVIFYTGRSFYMRNHIKCSVCGREYAEDEVILFDDEYLCETCLEE